MSKPNRDRRWSDVRLSVLRRDPTRATAQDVIALIDDLLAARLALAGHCSPAPPTPEAPEEPKEPPKAYPPIWHW
jgi:hypothetical protein